MKKILAFALTLALATVGVASATDLSVIHGIPGTDLGLDLELPVDISLNGACTLTGVPFGTVSEPLAVDPGLYTVEIRLSDGTCTGDLAITTQVALQLAESSTVIAHLTDSLTITATQFVNDLRAAGGNGRVTVRHTADAPAVDIYVKQPDIEGIRLFADIANGGQTKADVAAGNYNVGIVPAGVVPSEPSDLVFLAGETAIGGDVNTVFYAVGSLFTGSFTVLAQTFPL